LIATTVDILPSFALAPVFLTAAMAVFSKYLSYRSLGSLCVLLDLPVSLQSVLSYSNLVHAVSGAVGSITAMTVFFPLDTARTRLQVDDKRVAKGSIKVMKEIAQEEGLWSLYRGLGPVLSSLYCSNFVYFYTFHGLKTICITPDCTPSAMTDLLIGYIAGVFNVMVTTPLWVVNTRLKLQGAKFKTQQYQQSRKPYKGMIDGILRIIKEEGIGTLWSGTASSVILAGNPAIQFMFYEAIKRFLHGCDWIKNRPLQDLSAFEYFIVGAIAKAIATILSYPFQVAQSKQRSGRSSGEAKKQSMFQLLAAIFRENGVRGLYKGLEAKMLQTVFTAALMFVTYEKLAAFIFKLMRVQRKAS